MLYLYAFVRGLDSLPEAAGLKEAPIELLPLDGLAAVVSGHDELEPEIAAEALVAHAAVVDALMAQTGEVVPVRFGAVFADGRSLRAAAAPREAALEDVLARVRGRVEFGLHVVGEREEPRERPRSGRDRLLEKREQLRAAESAAALDAPLVELAVDSRRRLLRTPRLLLSAAYLVEREDADAFAEQAGTIVESAPEGHEILVTGPWPPYSFAELEGDLRAA